MMEFAKRRYFIALASSQVIFACIILLNELMAAVGIVFPWSFSLGQFHVYHMTFPFEHQSSWERVLLYCGAALIAIWFLAAKQSPTIRLPSLQSVLLLAALPTSSGVLLSHYLSPVGWCCEPTFAFHFGFPFSFLLGIIGFEYSVQQFSNYGLFEVLSNSELRILWRVLPYQLFLNVLFWTNIVFVLLSLASLLVHRNKIGKQVDDQVQSVGN